jgi:hypothetical protein
MLKVTMIFSYKPLEKLTWTDVIDVVVCPDGDANTHAYVVSSYRNNNAMGRIEYNHQYRKPLSVIIETDQ